MDFPIIDIKNSALGTANDIGATHYSALACQLDLGRSEAALRAADDLAATFSERFSDSLYYTTQRY